MPIRVSFFSFFFFLFCESLLSQNYEYSFVPLLKEHEKRGAEFYSSFQDSKGFMWIGSDMGILRYNGNNLKHFTIRDGLPDNTVFGFYEDKDGRIWGKTFSGKLFYIKNNIIYTNEYVNKRLIEVSEGKSLLSIVVKENIIYLGYAERPPIKIVFFPSLKFIDYKMYESQIYIFEIDKEKYIYGQNIQENEPVNQICLYKHDGKEYKHFFHEHFFLYNYSQILKTDFGFLLLLDRKALKISNDTLFFEKSIPYNVTGVAISEIDNDSTVYVSTLVDGMWMARLSREGISFEKKVFDVPQSSVFIDNNNNIWVAGLRDGLFVLPNYRFQSLYFSDVSLGNDIEFVKKIDFDKLMIGFKNREIIVLSKKKIINRFSNVGSMSAYFVITKFFDKIFVATQENQKHDQVIYQIKDNKKNKYIYNAKLGAIKQMVPFHSDSSIFIAQHNKLTKVKISSSGSYVLETIANERVNAVCIINDYLLYGTFDGIWIMNLKNKNKKPHHIVLNKRINHLQNIDNKLVVASMHGEGMIILGFNKIVNVSELDGLASDIIKCFLYDNKRKNLWVGTPLGLSRVVFSHNYSEFSILNYNANSGLKSNIVNDLELLNDTLFVVGPNGITVIPINNLPLSFSKPSLIVNKLEFNNALIDFSKPIRKLHYKERNMTIYFDVVCYGNSSNLQFYHRLLPFDTIWTATRENTISLKNLKYGRHTYELMACTFDKSNCSDIYKLNFQINYPFWYKWWFFLLILFFFFLVVYSITKLRFRNIRKKLHIKKMLYESEKKALRAQMNPHFIFNALTSIQKFIVTNNTEQAEYYVEQFAKLIRLILETSKEPKIKVDDEISIISLYLTLEKLRLKDKFDFEILKDKSIHSGVSMPSMLVQPIVENAVWHGVAHLKEKKGMIKISFSNCQNKIKCVIEDNGVGRLKNQPNDIHNKFKTSLGYEITKKRIELNEKSAGKINIKDLFDADGKPMGTRVEITV